MVFGPVSFVVFAGRGFVAFAGRGFLAFADRGFVLFLGLFASLEFLVFLDFMLLLKNFSMYLLNWPKLDSHRATRSIRCCCPCSSSPTTPSGRRSTTRHTRASAHAQRRVLG